MPLADLLMERFKIKTRGVENPEITSIGTTPLMVLKNNPNRLAATIVNLSTNVIYFGLKSDVAATKGVRLDANGGYATIIWDRDFQTTGWAWWVVASGAASEIFCIEVVEA